VSPRDLKAQTRSGAHRGESPVSAGLGLAHWLIEHAARRAPPPLSQRLEEEWLADLAARDRPLSRLRFGLGCCWAAMVIVNGHGSSAAAAAPASTSGNKSMTYAHPDPPVLSRRAVALLLIACVHTALIYALVIGVSSTVTEAPPVITGEVLPEPRPPIEPPALPRSRLVPSRTIDVPTPEIPIDTPRDAGTAETRNAPPRDPPAPSRTVNRILGGPGKGFPDSADYYPPASRRLAETGAAGVRVCVDAEGRLTTHPTLARSSGSVRLDDGALKLAQAGSGHYRPTTEDGRPVDSCYVFRIRFELRD
jgi:periplasmic protein TonB